MQYSVYRIVFFLSAKKAVTEALTAKKCFRAVRDLSQDKNTITVRYSQANVPSLERAKSDLKVSGLL